VLQSAPFVTGPWRYEPIDDAGHWLQVDAPARVNELLLARRVAVAGRTRQNRLFRLGGND
jgi:hypothetical protein